ncbi:MAG: MucB/RseB C-terminal domain-containing protein [Pseudomonadota bacterium]
MPGRYRDALWQLLVGSVLAWSTAWAQDNAGAQITADSLLRKVAMAVNETDYEGTLVRSSGGRIDTMHVWHRNDDGVILEKLVSMDGEGREVIRRGDELICLWPKRKEKLIDRDVGDTNAFLNLPETVGAIDKMYVLKMGPVARVAGREAVTAMIRPRDRLRYGYRLWLDRQTMLPLRMLTLSQRGVVEEIRFADLKTDINIPDSVFDSDIDSRDFKISYVGSAEKAPQPRAVTLDSAMQAAPAEQKTGPQPVRLEWPREPQSGFQLRSSSVVMINNMVSQSWVLSDGLATVSLYITQPDPASLPSAPQFTRMGAANSYRQPVGRYLITLVGEVPIDTLQMLATTTEGAIPQQRVDSAEDSKGAAIE